MLRRRLTALSTLAVLALPACGDILGGASSDCGMDQEVDQPPSPSQDKNAYIGMTVEEATAQARRDGLVARPLITDGVCADHIADLRSDRVNFEVKDGKVVNTAYF